MLHTIKTAIFVSIGLLPCISGCTSSENQRVESSSATAQRVAGEEKPAIQPEVVARFDGPMPTGVAVSKAGRIFVTFPRWGDSVDFTLAEVVNGKPVAFPNAEMNQLETQRPEESLISVQNVVVDDEDRLWIIDTGSIKMGPVKPGGPKLLCYDLKLNRVTKKIMFPDSVALPTTYLNDVRFDLKRGNRGMAYLTDSSDKGPNGIIVVDLDSEKSWRKLSDHPSTKADDNFEPIVEGSPLMQREPGKPAEHIKIGSDGIALDAAKGFLYYCPLASRKIYRVKLNALSDTMNDEQTAAQVEELPPRNFASDGIITDRDGTLYLTDYEHNAIHRFDERTKAYRLVATDPRMIWPDTMALGMDGYLFFTANQLNRQPRFHEGNDLRQKPYLLLRIRIPSQPVAKTDL